MRPGNPSVVRRPQGHRLRFHAGSSAPAGSDGAAAATGRAARDWSFRAAAARVAAGCAADGDRGYGRMRKSQLIAAIQEKQGGSAATEPRRSSAPSADRRPLAPRLPPRLLAPKFRPRGPRRREPTRLARSSRTPWKHRHPRKRQPPQRRAGSNGVQASSRGDQGGQQLSFDSGRGRCRSAGSAAPQARPAARRPRPKVPAVTASTLTRRAATAAVATTAGTVSRPRARDNNRDNNRVTAVTTAGTMAWRQPGSGDSRDRGDTREPRPRSRPVATSLTAR